MQTFILTATQNTSFIILKLNFELDIYIEEQLKITCSRVWCNFALLMDLVQVWVCKWLHICIHYVGKCMHAPKDTFRIRRVWEVSSLRLTSWRNRLSLGRLKKSLWKASQWETASDISKTKRGKGFPVLNLHSRYPATGWQYCIDV